MSVELKNECRHCAGHITYSSELVGTLANCPHCGKQLVLGKVKKHRLRLSVKHLAFIAGVVVLGFLGFIVTRMLLPKSPEEVFKAYAQCTKWEDRLKYVIEPDTVRERMKAAYAKGDFPKQTYWQSFLEESADRTLRSQIYGEDKDRAWVSWHTGKNEYGKPVWSKPTCYLFKVGGHWKVDWLLSRQWSTMSGKEFLLTKPKSPQEMRVKVRLKTTFYRIAKKDVDKVYPLHILFADGEDNVDAFVLRETTIGTSLYAALKDTKSDEDWLMWTLFLQFQSDDTLLEVVDGRKGWWTRKKPAK